MDGQFCTLAPGKGEPEARCQPVNGGQDLREGRPERDSLLCSSVRPVRRLEVLARGRIRGRWVRGRRKGRC